MQEFELTRENEIQDDIYECKCGYPNHVSELNYMVEIPKRIFWYGESGNGGL